MNQGKGKEVAKNKDKKPNYATWGESDAEMLSSDEGRSMASRTEYASWRAPLKVSSPTPSL